MKIIRTAGQLSRLSRMETAVWRAERKFVSAREARILSPGEAIVFPTRAPNHAEYASLSPVLLLVHIEELDLDPELVFADLGSGLGAACFAAAFHFKRVVGLELDPRLVEEAQRLQKQLGFDNVAFRNEDFLKADLSGCGVLYLFHPFSDNFVPLMAERLRDIPSGTLVISRVFNYARPGIFTAEFFERVHPVEIGEDEVGDDYVSNFITFRRK
jgi:predicted RNA methylase